MSRSALKHASKHAAHVYHDPTSDLSHSCLCRPRISTIVPQQNPEPNQTGIKINHYCLHDATPNPANKGANAKWTHHPALGACLRCTIPSIDTTGTPSKHITAKVLWSPKYAAANRLAPMKSSRTAKRRSSSRIRLLLLDIGFLKSSEEAISKCHILMPISGLRVTVEPMMVAPRPIVAAMFEGVIKDAIFAVTKLWSIDERL